MKFHFSFWNIRRTPSIIQYFSITFLSEIQNHLHRPLIVSFLAWMVRFCCYNSIICPSCWWDKSILICKWLSKNSSIIAFYVLLKYNNRFKFKLRNSIDICTFSVFSIRLRFDFFFKLEKNATHIHSLVRKIGIIMKKMN